MLNTNELPSDIVEVLHKNFGNQFSSLRIPPSSFSIMKGQIIEYCINSGYLKARYPVQDIFLNQFGNMQGGMLVAAIDNTLGPLSMLVAPPNISRTLNIKFRKPVKPGIEYVYAEARLLYRKKRQLYFNASLKDKNDTVLVTAQAIHWVIDYSGQI